MARWIRRGLCVAALLLAPGSVTYADTPATAFAQIIKVAYITRQDPPIVPLSFLEPVVKDPGASGARLGQMDDATTGKFLNQDYDLVETIVPADGDLAAAARKLITDGRKLFIADLTAKDLLTLADLPEAKGVVILNVRAREDDLRESNCRANVLHVAPSYAILADALTQYLLTKHWLNWFLVTGPAADDKLYAAALQNAAKRYRANLVGQKDWTFDPGSRRSDTGHEAIAGEVVGFTSNLPAYDILLVADTQDQFGEYFQYRTQQARPVAGTQGLAVVTWTRAMEEWGASSCRIALRT